MSKDIKIMIVEDNEASREILGSLISRSTDYQIIMFESGKEFLDKIAKMNVREYPDLLLLDIMMPVINGFEVAEQIKSNDKTKNIPIIFVTALSSVEDHIKGFSYGAVDYITKPYDIKEVICRINTHLKIKLMQDFFNKQLQLKTGTLKKIYHKLDLLESTSINDLLKKEITDTLQKTGYDLYDKDFNKIIDESINNNDEAFNIQIFKNDKNLQTKNKEYSLLLKDLGSCDLKILELEKTKEVMVKIIDKLTANCKKMEYKLKKEGSELLVRDNIKDYYENIINKVQSGLIILDTNNNIIFSNEYCCNFFNVSKDKINLSSNMSLSLKALFANDAFYNTVMDLLKTFDKKQSVNIINKEVFIFFKNRNAKRIYISIYNALSENYPYKNASKVIVIRKQFIDE